MLSHWENTVAGLDKQQLSDIIPRIRQRLAADKSGKPAPAHKTIAENTRESDVCAGAQNAEAANRDRMVDNRRGNQQAGCQGS